MGKNYASDNHEHGKPVEIKRERRPDVKPVDRAKERPRQERTTNTGTARQIRDGK